MHFAGDPIITELMTGTDMPDLNSAILSRASFVDNGRPSVPDTPYANSASSISGTM
jgi:hypothetical protein